MTGFWRASVACVWILGGLLTNCGHRTSNSQPSIEFTVIPEADWGGSGLVENIEGRVQGSQPDQRIVILAKSGSWWTQPSDAAAFTAIQPDSTWKNSIHLGTEYAALLVEPSYSPSMNVDALPGKGGGVVAVATVHALPGLLAPKKLRFSGYEWDVRQMPSDGGGIAHANSAANAWTDAKGWLHLRITHDAGAWSCAEVNLTRSLGYGTYTFIERPSLRFEPSTVLGLFTYDHVESGQDHREIDIELSQWGDAAIKNAQYVVQPYYVPANVLRFMSPPEARLIHSFKWEDGRVSFKTIQETPGLPARAIAEHVFTSGIPHPGQESIHLNLYIYGRSRMPQEKGVEVIIEKFQYLP